MKTVFILVTLLVSSCLTPAFALAESDPFELKHPVTGEDGVWIPVWVQKIHLETDAKLKLCTDAFDADQAMLAEKNSEILERVAATEALLDALKHTREQLVAEQGRLRAAQSTAQTRLIWMLIATGGALVTGTILTIDLVH